VITAPLSVVVSGPPGAGKSTLARRLVREVHLPLVAKDTIKEALMSVLPVRDIEASGLLGRASMAVLFALAAESPIGALIEANFRRSLSGASIAALPGQVSRCSAPVHATPHEAVSVRGLPSGIRDTSTRTETRCGYGTRRHALPFQADGQSSPLIPTEPSTPLVSDISSKISARGTS
jgi:hypothetical protein